VFFAGANRSRSRDGVFGILAAALLAGAFCFATVKILRFRSPHGIPLAVWLGFVVAFGSAAALLVGLFCYAVWGWLVRREIPVRVTADGVERGRRAWRWHQISAFGGSYCRRLIWLEFTLRKGGMQFPKHLATAPKLTQAEYDDLIARLTPYLAERHPHVRVALTPCSRD
jgi:hypothetical protein